MFAQFFAGVLGLTVSTFGAVGALVAAETRQTRWVVAFSVMSAGAALAGLAAAFAL